MIEVRFTAFEYNSNDSFTDSVYEMKGSEESGWHILRNSSPYLELGKGYRLLKTELCGICSTDLDRRFLPFPLPQIIGHEVVASDYLTGEKYVLEINDTVVSRGEEPDPFCKVGIPTHSPTRMVLGIDRLPGGFGPYILAPKGNLVEIKQLEDMEAVLLEPFAASLHGVEVSVHRAGTQLRKIAVLGPRRLGSLVIAALDLYRKRSNLNYEIVSLIRHQSLANLSLRMGADQVLYFSDLGEVEVRDGLLFEKNVGTTTAASWSDYKQAFDLIFDTTGSVSGLETSTYLTQKEIHRKTTNGQASLGIEHLTELVVDEISVTNLRSDFLDLVWGIEVTSPALVFVSSSASLDKEEKDLLEDLEKKDRIRIFTGSIKEGTEFLESQEFPGTLPRFDFAIIDSSSELDTVIRPDKKEEKSLVRPRGFILIPKSAKHGSNLFLDWIVGGGILSTSRCGDFVRTRELLETEPGFLKSVSENLISKEFDSRSIPEAYTDARKPENIKVVVRHKAS
ncbi:alcohol dehydrogenase catalytic domain-containing protein [Leptospira johnsonii]|uniref:Alcohol dehydrogenase, catalytic domain, GroES-like family / oxidoreductase, zinc-binding dehydrogenase family multi-domain protein n=1 Tax=Leptospira johnsonii TaxID=1917820 RepID=A0A2P2D5H6_9LEPT|nr:alcohol dehydrogenase catalytic domain-containing protein [Leptospira johnsonii]GBF39855.1 alcohol dehydrogenase, catalytic domain, GroES-like family / oxidoreductase, zinc-binding dehydrogenase family multi-domain protein [Leptospira johnsonii]